MIGGFRFALEFVRKISESLDKSDRPVKPCPTGYGDWKDFTVKGFGVPGNVGILGVGVQTQQHVVALARVRDLEAEIEERTNDIAV